MTVALGINGHTLDVLGRFGDYEYGSPDATEVPVVGTALSEIHLWHGALLEYLHLQTVFLITEEHTVADIHRMTCEASLIGTVTCLPTVDLHTDLREGSLKHQLYLSSFPFLRECKLRLVFSLLVSDALRGGLAIEAHTILVGTEALQFPT